MPLKKIGYLNAVSGDDDDEFLLAASTCIWRHNNKDTTTVQQNVGSVLFVYKGERFGPYAAQSVPPVDPKDRTGHSERRAFSEAIRNAISWDNGDGNGNGWGPFRDCGLSAKDIPDYLSMENINSNQKLKSALSNLNELKIFSERAFCDYTQKKEEDLGCKPYFEKLETEVLQNNTKVHMLHALPPQIKKLSVKALEAVMTSVEQQIKLIHEKQELIKKRVCVLQDINKTIIPQQISSSTSDEAEDALASASKRFKHETEEDLAASVTMTTRAAASRQRAINIRESKDIDNRLKDIDNRLKDINKGLKTAFEPSVSLAQPLTTAYPSSLASTNVGHETEEDLAASVTRKIRAAANRQRAINIRQSKDINNKEFKTAFEPSVSLAQPLTTAYSSSLASTNVGRGRGLLPGFYAATTAGGLNRQPTPLVGSTATANMPSTGYQQETADKAKNKTNVTSTRVDNQSGAKGSSYERERGGPGGYRR